jgi:hypothetical protein
MGYSYEELRPGVLTDEGQRRFLKVRDHVFKLLDAHEIATGERMMAGLGLGGTNWDAMACIDRMVELGEIRVVARGERLQDTVYRRG